MTETMLEMVTSWPVVAIVTGLEEPKNSVATSIKNMPVRDCIIHVEKKATAKEGTNSLPTEDFSSVFCKVNSSCRYFQTLHGNVLQLACYVNIRINR